MSTRDDNGAKDPPGLWPEEGGSTSFPDNDRTVIVTPRHDLPRPSQADAPHPGAVPVPPAQPPVGRQRSQPDEAPAHHRPSEHPVRRSTVEKQTEPSHAQSSRPRWPLFVLAAAIFLGLGAGGGWLALQIGSGRLTIADLTPSLSDPDAEAPPVVPELEPPVSDPSEPPSKLIVPETDVAVQDPDEPVLPSDPFHDMAISAVIPLTGDPVLLKDEAAAGRRIELTERSVDLTLIPDLAANAGDAVPTIYVLDSEMLDAEGRLITRAPGSEADFRFGNFGGGESEADTAISSDAGADSAAGASADDIQPVGPGGLPVFLRPPSNTLSLFLSERPIGQGPQRIDVVRAVDRPVALADLLRDASFDAEAASEAADFARTEFGVDRLDAGFIVAARGVRMPNRIGRIGDYYRPVQVSIYGLDGYKGTAALSTARDQPGYLAGADPWFGVDLRSRLARTNDRIDGNPGKDTSHRLIDGLYATAVRNAVPASIVGEAIADLSAMIDLKRPVKPGERFTMVFSDTPRDRKRGTGRVLFAGIRLGDAWSAQCYVMPTPGRRGHACVNEGGTVSVSGAMLVPVKGVLTSRFGMRFHPIAKTERLHAGVDWAAAAGTPIHAAFSGKIIFHDVRGGYGNFIEIAHKDSITTRYAHMSRFAEEFELGSQVQAGDLIGYVGTTGLSTGPHLHFEIRDKGVPIDPLTFEMAADGEAPQTVTGAGLDNMKKAVALLLAGQ